LIDDDDTSEEGGSRIAAERIGQRIDDVTQRMRAMLTAEEQSQRQAKGRVYGAPTAL
jgi:hypothetical protein